MKRIANLKSLSKSLATEINLLSDLDIDVEKLIFTPATSSQPMPSPGELKVETTINDGTSRVKTTTIMIAAASQKPLAGEASTSIIKKSSPGAPKKTAPSSSLPTPPPPPPPSLTCKKCCRVFTTPSGLEFHAARKHCAKNDCEKCGREFVSWHNLQTHEGSMSCRLSQDAIKNKLKI